MKRHSEPAGHRTKGVVASRHEPTSKWLWHPMIEMMPRDLIAELPRMIEQARRTQQRFYESKRLAEELATQSERLFTEAAQARQRVAIKIANAAEHGKTRQE